MSSHCPTSPHRSRTAPAGRGPGNWGALGSTWRVTTSSTLSPTEIRRASSTRSFRSSAAAVPLTSSVSTLKFFLSCFSGNFFLRNVLVVIVRNVESSPIYTVERRGAGCSNRVQSHLVDVWQCAILTYVSRSVYADRDKMLYEHATKVAGTNGTVMWADDIIREDLAVDEDVVDVNGSRRVVILKEGAGSVQALLGVMRLVEYLSGLTFFGKDEKAHIVVDAGTGTTAVGLALGAVCLGLQWRVTAVMLADTLEKYKEREKSLIFNFKRLHNEFYHGIAKDDSHDSLVHWVYRFSPRRFGKVLDGEITMCREIAQQTGILLDPMYTLAAWEQAVKLCCGDNETKVAMIHTGGTLGLFGLAQRYSPQFTANELGQPEGGLPYC